MSPKNLFRSQTFADILCLFFSQKDRKFFVREISRLTNHDVSLVQKELSRMEKEGLITSSTEGKNKYFIIKNSELVSYLEKILLDSNTHNQSELLTVLFQEHWISPLTISVNLRAWPALRYDKRFLKTNIGPTATALQNNSLKWSADMIKIIAASDEIIKNIFNPSFFKTYDETFRHTANAMKQCLDEIIHQKNIDEYWLKKISDLYSFGTEICQLGYIGVLCDLSTNNCTKKIKDIVEKYLNNHKISYSRQEIISIIGSPEELTYSQQRELSLLQICLSFFKKNITTVNQLNSADHKIITDYYFKYYWTNFGHFGFEADPKNTLTEISELLKIYNTTTITQRIKEIQQGPTEIKTKKEEIFRLLPISKEEISMIQIAATITYHKAVRLELLSGLHACLRLLVDATHKKIKIIPQHYLYQCNFQELVDSYTNGITDALANELQNREKFVIWLAESDVTNMKIIHSNEAIHFFETHIKEMEADIREVERIHGTVAYSGKVRGKVKILNSPKELDKIKLGDILVTHQTVPEMLPGMKLAAAFITDSGGITCHAAIVAREMKKPCITGTEIGTKILKDGDLVEVDAFRGEVTIIQVT